MKILDKIFCHHSWKSHAKNNYEWTESQIVKGTELFYKPVLEKYIITETVEVLICEKCGKVKKINY